MRSLSPGQRLLKHRREAQREGTSSGAARHLPQRGRQRGPLPSLTKNASIFRQIHLPLNRQLRCLGKALGWRFSPTNQNLTTEQLPILTQIHTFCGGVDAAATPFLPSYYRFETTVFWDSSRFLARLWGTPSVMLRMPAPSGREPFGSEGSSCLPHRGIERPENSTVCCFQWFERPEKAPVERFQ